MRYSVTIRTDFVSIGTRRYSALSPDHGIASRTICHLAGHGQEHDDDSVLIADFRAFHDRAAVDVEPLALTDLLLASEWYQLVLVTGLDFERFVVQVAYGTLRPTQFDKLVLGLCVSRELPHNGFQTDAFTV